MLLSQFLKEQEMDMFDSLFASGCELIEQIAGQVFSTLPEQGPIVLLVDRQANYWPSDSERFNASGLSETFIKDLCEKIDDGYEPLMSQSGDFSIVGTQLATERTNCGYLIIVLPKYSPETTLTNIDLIQTLLNQITVIASLIEKNNHVHDILMRQVSEPSLS